MQPTLQDGQWIIAIRSQISPGDVAIFYNPHTQSLNVKRYIMDSLQSPNIQKRVAHYSLGKMVSVRRTMGICRKIL